MKFLSQPRRASLVLLITTVAIIALAAEFIEDRTVFFVVMGVVVFVYFRLKIRLLKKHLKEKNKE